MDEGKHTRAHTRARNSRPRCCRFVEFASFRLFTLSRKQKKGIKSSIGRLFGKKEKGGRMEQTIGREPLPALTGPLQTKRTTQTCICPCTRARRRMLLFCASDFEMGIGDTMTLGKLGTQAERDRRMKKK